MASMFEQRERAFEAKWAHDEEMQFRVIVRRNELLAGWAASELGLQGEHAARYVAAIVAMGLRTKEPRGLFLKLRADLGAAHTEAVILGKMVDFLHTAGLDAGLAQRAATETGEVHAHRLGESEDDVAHVDLARILGHGCLNREGETHFRMLRKISTRP